MQPLALPHKIRRENFGNLICQPCEREHVVPTNLKSLPTPWSSWWKHDKTDPSITSRQPGLIPSFSQWQSAAHMFWYSTENLSLSLTLSLSLSLSQSFYIKVRTRYLSPRRPNQSKTMAKKWSSNQRHGKHGATHYPFGHYPPHLLLEYGRWTGQVKFDVELKVGKTRPSISHLKG